jgi:hypothetical protein
MSYNNIENLCNEMTVAELMKHYGKSNRGVKNVLTLRGLSCKDYRSKRIDTNFQEVPHKDAGKKVDYSTITEKSLPMSIAELNSTTTLNLLLTGQTQYQKSNVVNQLAARCQFHVVICLPMLKIGLNDTIKRLNSITQDPDNPFKVIEYNPKKQSAEWIQNELDQQRCIFIVGMNQQRLEPSQLLSAMEGKYNRKNWILFIDESDLFAENLLNLKDYVGREWAFKRWVKHFDRVLHVTATPMSLFLRRENIPDVILLREPPHYVGYRDYSFKSLDSKINLNDYVEIVQSVYSDFSRGRDNLFIYNQKTNAIHDEQASAICRNWSDELAVITVADRSGIRVWYGDQVEEGFSDIQAASTRAYECRDIVVYLAGQMLGRQQSVVDEAGLYPVRNIVYTSRSITNGSSVIQMCGRASGSYPDRVNRNAPIIYCASQELAKEIRSQHEDSARLTNELYTNFPNGASDEEKSRYIAQFEFEAKDNPVMGRMMNGFTKSKWYSQEEIDASPLITEWIPAEKIDPNYETLPKDHVVAQLQKLGYAINNVHNYRVSREPDKVPVITKFSKDGKYQMFSKGVRVRKIENATGNYRFHSHLGTEKLRLDPSSKPSGYKLS